MIRQQCPGVATDAGLGEERDEPCDEELAVIIVVENIAPFDTTHNDVLKEYGAIIH